MKITVKLFASLSRYLPPGAKENAAELVVPEGATPATVLAELRVPPGEAHLLLVNGVYVAPAHRDATALQDGDAVAMWPPVGGG